MPLRADRQRIWVVLLVGVLQWGSLPLAIELNDRLGSWDFISDDLRNVGLILSIALVFGIVSQTYPLRVTRAEAFAGTLFSGLFIVEGIVVIYLRGLWFGPWTLLPPVMVFLSQVSFFYLGRWIGRIPHRKIPNPAAEG